MFVFDATPLIYVATVDRLDLLEHVDHECLIPEPVYDEVVAAGLEAGYPEARRVEGAVEDDVFEASAVVDPRLLEQLEEIPNLSDADASVIAVADDNDGIAILDERYGRTVAETEGVETRGTLWIVLSAVRDGHTTSLEARETVDEMIDAGWYCSTDLYTRVVRKLESIG